MTIETPVQEGDARSQRPLGFPPGSTVDVRSVGTALPSVAYLPDPAMVHMPNVSPYDHRRLASATAFG
jgi:hypothetical protein